MRRHELSDEDWGLIEDLFPANGEGPGRPWREHRAMINGIFWILRTGAPWRDLPERYGPWQTVYDRFSRYVADGMLDAILERLQVRLDEAGRIDWDLWCVDGSSVRASRAAAGAGKKGAPESRRTTLWGAREADSGARCTWLLTAAGYRSRRR
jgi:transposase